MKDDVASKEKLSGPQLAVQSYLDELLQEATVYFEAKETDDIEEPEVASSPLAILQKAELETASIDVDEREPPVLEEANKQPEEVENSVAEKTKPETETTQDITTEDIASEEDIVTETLDQPVSIEEFEKVVSQPIEATEPEIESAQSISVIEADNKQEESVTTELTVPEPELEEAPKKEDELPWAESRFECLLFNVGGLKIAVPLVELGSIQKAGFDTITSIFGQPDWFIGISSINDLRIRTVDTAKWVMPNHYKGELAKEFKFIIQLDRSNWGLACEEVAEAITLEPSEVKWRADRTKRPWLAGTVIKHMCAILDVQGFINLLDDPKNGFNPSRIK